MPYTYVSIKALWRLHQVSIKALIRHSHMATMPYTHVSVKALLRPYEGSIKALTIRCDVIHTCPHMSSFFFFASRRSASAGLHQEAKWVSFSLFFSSMFFSKTLAPHSSGLGSAKLRHALVQAIATSNKSRTQVWVVLRDALVQAHATCN